MNQQLQKAVLTVFLLLTYLAGNASVQRSLIGQGFDNTGGHTFESYDFNNDGTNDLSVRLIVVSSSSYKLVVTGLNGTKVETNGSFMATPYNAGAVMGGSNYQDSAYIDVSNFPSSINSRFVGFKFKIGGQYCCAYLGFRMLSYSAPAFDVLWYGYETTSTICIAADATSSLGVNGQPVLSELRVFPNPSRGKLSIFCNQPGFITVEVVNASGQRVFNDQVQQKNNQEPIQFNIPVPGLYFVCVANAIGARTVQVIIY